MKKVLITGISGFVGRHLTNYLLTQSSYSIYGVDHSITGLPHELADKVTLHQADLKVPEQVSSFILETKPDFICHLAALTSPKASYDDPSQALINNILAELYILETLRLHAMNSVRVLIISTAEVYGLIKPSDLPVNETTQLLPASPYAVSKIAQDFLALQYFITYKQNNVRLRPFNHIGPGQRDSFVISSFAKQIAEIEKGLKEPVLMVGNLESKRDFTDVRDIVRAYTLAMEKGVSGEVYNLGSGTSHKIGDLLQKLLSFSKKNIKVEINPELFRPSDIPDTICDSTKFSKLTGWKPEIPIEQTLKDTLDYWRGVV